MLIVKSQVQASKCPASKRWRWSEQLRLDPGALREWDLRSDAFLDSVAFTLGTIFSVSLFSLLAPDFLSPLQWTPSQSAQPCPPTVERILGFWCAGERDIFGTVFNSIQRSFSALWLFSALRLTSMGGQRALWCKLQTATCNVKTANCKLKCAKCNVIVQLVRLCLPDSFLHFGFRFGVSQKLIYNK